MPATAEERILEGLNEAQREAVVHGEGPLLIIAGAGTGKTTVLTRRIAHLIATKRARPEEILALTFTEKAAAEMAERVDQLIPWGYAETAISTFHAFGDRVLRESRARGRARPAVPRALAAGAGDLPARAALPAAARPLPPARRPHPPPGRARDPREPREGRGRLARAVPGLGRGEARGRGDARTSGTRPRRTSSSRPSTRRTSGCSARRGSWTSATRSTAPSPCCASGRPSSRGCAPASASSSWTSSRTRTTRSSRCSSSLAGETANLTVVGDDDQAIYRWRGAAAANLLAFRRLYPGAREVVLVENYRSTQVILDTAARLVGYNNPYRLEAIAGHRQAAPLLARERPPGAPRALRHRVGGGRRRRRDDRGADPGGRPAAGLRDPRAQQRRRRPLPPGAQRQGPPAPLQRQPRPLRARGGAPPRLVPPRPREPRRLGLALLPRGVRGLRDARGRPPPPQPLRAAQDAPAPRGAPRPAGERGPRLGLGEVPRRGRAAPRRPRAGDGRGAAAAHRRGALRLPAVVGAPGAADEGVLGRGRGEGPEHRPLLRGGEGLRRRGRARPRARVRRAPRPAARGRGRPGGGRGRPRRGRGPRPDRAQGEGPRVPPRLPGGLRRVEVPAAAARGTRWGCPRSS